MPPAGYEGLEARRCQSSFVVAALGPLQPVATNQGIEAT